jgi:hypothetical protein
MLCLLYIARFAFDPDDELLYLLDGHPLDA